MLQMQSKIILKLLPDIITAAIFIILGLVSVVFITNAKRPIKERIARPKWVNPFIGSLVYVFHKFPPINFFHQQFIQSTDRFY